MLDSIDDKVARKGIDLPPVEDLRRLFSYDPDTGRLTRLVSTAANAKAGDAAGYRDGDGYLVLKIYGVKIKVHRICFALHHGVFPVDMQVSHRNGDKLDNRASNLRLSTCRQNRLNQTRLRPDNKSGFRGVLWDKQRRKWKAVRRIGGGKKAYLGHFDSAEEAGAAYQRSFKSDLDYCGEVAPDCIPAPSPSIPEPLVSSAADEGGEQEKPRRWLARFRKPLMGIARGKQDA